MMTLFWAEWRKIVRHRFLIGCMIWIWPLMSCIVVTLWTLIILVDSGSRQNFIKSHFEWTDIALVPWVLLNSPLGRLMLIGFAATVFAGEYQYQTWKTVIPGNSRFQILLTKYVALATFVILSFILMTILLVISLGLMNLLVGSDYPPALSWNVLQDFVRDLVLNASLTYISTLILTGIAILIAIFTRSILFAIIVSLIISLLEFLGLRLLLLFAAELLGWDWMIDFLVFTPSYHVENITSWVNFDEGVVYFNRDHLEVSLLASVGALLIWLLGLISLSVFLFQRQDIQ